MKKLNVKYFKSIKGEEITLFNDDFKLYQVKRLKKPEAPYSNHGCNTEIYNSVKVTNNSYEVYDDIITFLKKDYKKDVKTIYEIEYDFKELDYKRDKSKEKLIIDNPDKFDFIIADDLINNALKKYIIRDRDTNVVYYVAEYIFKELERLLS